MILKNKKNLNLIVDTSINNSFILQTNWEIVFKRSTPYAVTRLKNLEDKKIKRIYLHRLIMEAKPGQFVDHINGNTLDNRKENLRLCSNAENVRNQKISVKNTSGYKGVYFIKRNLKKPFNAYINYNKKRINLGYFKTDKEAAEAYNEAAIKYHKEFSRLNKIG